MWGANQADCAPDNPILNPCPNSRPILAHITRESGVKEYFCYQEGVNPDDLALQCSLYHAGIPNPPGAEWGLSETNCDFNLFDFYKFNYTVTWYERELTEKPQLLPCSNRGRCTSQGTCVCDSANFVLDRSSASHPHRCKRSGQFAKYPSYIIGHNRIS